MEIGNIERHFGVQLAAGVSTGPGTLMNVNSSGTGRLADASSSLPAHGIALTSGAGTKTAGMSQFVALYRSARVTNVDYTTLTIGNTAYLGEDGQVATTSGGLAQNVGICLKTDEVFMDLDLHFPADGRPNVA